jgi:hypothetical protein
MNNREVRELLGITFADLLAYVATAAVVGMFLAADPTVDMLLAVVALAFVVAACRFGMKRRPDISNFTNVIKLISYPFYVLVVLGAIVIHYVLFAK